MICRERSVLIDKKQYPVVDLLKYICSLLVVSIHRSPLKTYFDTNPITEYLNFGFQNYLARIAVPFYFAVAGFFLFRKINFEKIDTSVFQKYIFKSLRLLGIWFILLFAGKTHHLWYMSGLVIAVCILTLLIKKGFSLRKIVIIASVLYIIGLLGDSYYGLIQPLQKFRIFDFAVNTYYELFKTTRNGLFMGFPFLVVGGVIEKKKFSIKPVSAFIGFAVSMAALFCEVFLVEYMGLSKDVNMYIFLIPATFFMLVFALNVPAGQMKISKELRNVGIIVYFSHLLVYQFIDWGWKAVYMLSGVEVNNSLLDYFLAVLFSTVLGILIDKLSKKEKLSFLRYLYS